MNLGFIGLGKMGHPMAEHLVRAGHHLFLYNRSKEIVENWHHPRVQGCDCPASVGKASDIVFLCLPSGREVREVLGGESGLLAGLKTGSVIIDHSTVAPSDSKLFYQWSKDKNCGFLDAPVSGGVHGAQNGTLSIMVGGERAVFEKVLPLLQLIGKNIYYLGDSGSGNSMKLINNLLVGITNAALGEAFTLAAKAGLDNKQVYDIISCATGDSAMLRRNLPGFAFPWSFEPSFTLDMLNKDLGLVLNFAAANQVDLPLGDLAFDVGSSAAQRGWGSEDMSVVLKYYAQKYGLDKI